MNPIKILVLLSLTMQLNSVRAAMVNPDDSTKLLFKAVSIGDLTRVIRALNDGAKINSKTDSGWTPLHLAAEFGHMGITELLIEQGADKDAQSNAGRRPMHNAIRQRRVNVVKLLIAKGAIVDNSEKAALLETYHQKKVPLGTDAILALPQFASIKPQLEELKRKQSHLIFATR